MAFTDLESFARFSRSFLSFRDLCASRPVCRNWHVVNDHSIEEPIFILEEDSAFPNRSHAHFQRCLRAAKLLNIVAEVETKEQVAFLKSIASHAKSLRITADAEEDSIWDQDFFENASTIEDLHLEFYGNHNPHKIDFNQLPNLRNFHSNIAAIFQNYDQQPMDHFSYTVDYFNKQACEILLNTKVLRLHLDEKPTAELFEYADRWVRREIENPKRWVYSINELTFCTQEIDKLLIHPVSGLGDQQFNASLDTYRLAFVNILVRNPHIPIYFDVECNQSVTEAWKRIIINPIRVDLGLQEI